MNSYQRRKRDIQYLRQVIKETRALCCAIVGYAKKEGHEIKVPLAFRGIAGDDFITDINDFSMYLSITRAEILIEKSRGS